MGLCSSSESGEATSRLIDKQVTKKKRSDKEVKKLLLLGAGASGKSTFFKQLTYIHGPGFSERDRQDFARQVEHQIIENMQKLLDKANDCVDQASLSSGDTSTRITRQSSADIVRAAELVEASETRSIESSSTINAAQSSLLESEFRVNDSLRDSVEFVCNLKKSAFVTKEVADHVERLWNDEAVRRVWSMRNELRLACPDSCDYFFDHVQRVALEGYLPEEQEIFLVRTRSLGIRDISIEISDPSGQSSTLRIFDVGGQRSERRKWYHFFNNVTSVLYVASLSSYNEVIIEDERTNRMFEALKLFKQLTQVPYFEQTPFILFLNKCDLFEEKLTRVPLSVCFDSYDGPNDFDSATEFIKEQFEIRDTRKLEHGLYIHLTTAIDTDNVFRLFQSVNYIVVNANMQKVGVV